MFTSWKNFCTLTTVVGPHLVSLQGITLVYLECLFYKLLLLLLCIIYQQEIFHCKHTLTVVFIIFFSLLLLFSSVCVCVYTPPIEVEAHNRSGGHYSQVLLLLLLLLLLTEKTLLYVCVRECFFKCMCTCLSSFPVKTLRSCLSIYITLYIVFTGMFNH